LHLIGNNVKTLEKWRKKHSSENKLEQVKVDKFVSLGSVAQKNGKIQNEINEKIGKASKCYNLAKSLLWNKDIDRKWKITIYNVYLKKILLYGAETWTCSWRQRSKLLYARVMKYL
jgi:hypothetical protein